MFSWIDQSTVVGIFCGMLAASLPLLMLAYYFLRLRLRRNILEAKILELGLESEYLHVFHFAEWEKLKAKNANQIRAGFETAFIKHFQSDNSFKNYCLPLLFACVTTFVLSYFIYQTLSPADVKALGLFEKKVLPFALAGAFLYIYPLLISRYASLSLNPPTQLDLIGKLWLSTLIGIVTTFAVTESLQPIAGFLGGLVPLASIDLLKKKVFQEEKDPDAVRRATLLEILHEDRNLLIQLDYVGIRSVLHLAYENPLKIFTETDLNLVVCIDLVDQANLYLYVPEGEIRKNLNRLGIRTAIDLMTQLYGSFPKIGGTPGEAEYRYLDLEEELPGHLKDAMAQIAKVMKLESVEALRNLILMMVENPQLEYILGLWNMLSGHVENRKKEEKDKNVNAEVKILKAETDRAEAEARIKKAKEEG